MFRKIALALAATTVVAAAAIPTSASAWDGGWRHRHHHSRFSVTIGSPYYAYAPRCYVARRWVHTPWGWRLRPVRRCY